MAVITGTLANERASNRESKPQPTPARHISTLPIGPNRLLIIGGAVDRFTPPRYVRLLHEHWKGSHRHCFPGNHMIHLQCSKYLTLMKWFMDRHTKPANPHPAESRRMS